VIHVHSIYGIALVSDYSVPGLSEDAPRPGEPHITLNFGSQPDWAAQALRLPASKCYPLASESVEPYDPALTITSFAHRRYFQLAYADGAAFFVDAHQNRIWACCPASLTKEDHCTYLVGPVMGFILRLRGTLCLHASSTSIAGQTVALCGASAAGKSTTGAALALRGIPVLTEDVTPIKELSSSFIVEPGYPRICLWPDSVKQLLGSADALPLLTPNWDKRYLPLDGVRATFESEPKPLGAIYLLSARTNDSDAPRIEDMPPRDALLGLVQNTYMNWLIDHNQRAAEFDFLAKLADRVPIRRLTPHADPARLPALCDLIIEDVMSVVAAEPARTIIAPPC
jgi:hypothetical protein